MQRETRQFLSVLIAIFILGGAVTAQDDDVAKQKKSEYQAAALKAGDLSKGKLVFQSEKAACKKCHEVGGKNKLAGPDLAVIGDKYTRDQLIQQVLEPSARLHPDYASQIVITTDGLTITGVLRQQSDKELQLIDAEGKLVKIALDDVEDRKRSSTSLMPSDIYKNITADQFSDLVEYLASLKQAEGDAYPGMPSEIKVVAKPAKVVPLHPEAMRFDHPVCVIAKPGTDNTLMIVEQQTRKIYALTEGKNGLTKELFADISHEAITGQFEGVLCLAFHPDFLKNRKYYLNYHVEENDVFSPVIVERTATEDLTKDKGGASRRLLQIPQPTVMHWGGMLAFGPDGYLYIGAGDGGPQEDPLGNGQNMSLFLGKILRIDVNKKDAGKEYAVPESNPFKDVGPAVKPEIWAYGFRMPWRFSWDSKTDEMYVGDIGQNLFEEVNMPRIGENHGWNVYEGFERFSDQYKRGEERFTPPVVSYRRKRGVSVTGGYVYRGTRSPSYVGAYIFSDFESKTIWAMTQEDRKLTKIREIGKVPEKPASFGIDADGELLIVGYEGTIFRLELDESVFE
jgi:putative heme-binding domain-containing protein